jgi:NTE family protein
VLAGGGERAVAWERGVLAGLADRGVDVMGAERIVGTSAGALVATALALGEPPAEPDGPGPPPPGAADGLGALSLEWAEAAALGGREGRRRVGALALAAYTAPANEFVAETERRLPPAAARGPWPAALVIAAVDAVTGERVAYSEDDGLPLGPVVAASRAVPGVRAPVEIRGHANVDGAVSSATNADLAAGAELVVIVDPTPPEPPPGSLFALWEAALREEVEHLRAGGAVVEAIRATSEDLAAMGPHPLNGARAVEAFRAGRERGRAPGSVARSPDP